MESKQQDFPFKNHLGVGFRMEFQSVEKLGIGFGKDIQIQVATRIETLSPEAKRLFFMKAFGFKRGVLLITIHHHQTLPLPPFRNVC